MRVLQNSWNPGQGWSAQAAADGDAPAQLVLVFGSTAAMARTDLFEQVRAWHPQALIAGCSTAGEILDTCVSDGSIVVSALHFEHTEVDWASVPIADAADSRRAAQQIAQALVRPGLRHVIVLTDGLVLNGTVFAAALREHLPPEVCATGGLAGDGDRFEQTLVCGNAPARSGQAIGIGLYGERLQVGYGSLGGWDSFGPLRRITRAAGNVLFELDGQSALELYKSYLGEQHAAGLPGTALLFPLLLEDGQGGAGLVRTVLGVDEAAGSMTFAGDMPEGTAARLMKANFDRLVDGASGAAQAATGALGGEDAQFALLISCVGRKLVLRQRVEEEVESVREVLGKAALTGFYSYGELCPRGELGGCELHNQTMTITTLRET